MSSNIETQNFTKADSKCNNTMMSVNPLFKNNTFLESIDDKDVACDPQLQQGGTNKVMNNESAAFVYTNQCVDDDDEDDYVNPWPKQS